MRLVYARDNDLTYKSIRFDISLQNFKKPLDIFSPQYLVIILTVKESFERFSCIEFIFEKSKYREASLKHRLKLLISLKTQDF